MAIQTARIVTGRKKVMVFEGCYHGAVFIFRNGPHVRLPRRLYSFATC